MTRDEDQTGRAALETALERLLSVDPSPEFTARIRARVSNDAMAPSAFERWRWFVLRGAVVAAAIVAVLTVVMRMNRTPMPDAVPQARTIPQVPRATTSVTPQIERSKSDEAPVVAPTRASVVHSASSAVASVAAVTSAPGVTVPAPARDPFSDVQVSANELKALRQIAMLLEGKRLELDERTPVPAVREDVKELVITPITIEPIQLVMIKGDAE